MTPIADMVELMFKENAPATAIVAAVRAMERVTFVTRDVTSSSRDASRSQSRARSKRYRDNKKNQRLAGEAKANDVADRHASVTQNVTTPPLRDCVVLSSLLPEEPLKKGKAERMRARGTRMEPGTPLSAEHRALILAEGIHDPEKFWAEFVDYWSEVPGQRGVKVGWTGTLRNRCRDVIGKGFNRPFNGQNHGKTQDNPKAGSLIGAIDRRLAALAIEGEPDPALPADNLLCLPSRSIQRS